MPGWPLATEARTGWLAHVYIHIQKGRHTYMDAYIPIYLYISTIYVEYELSMTCIAFLDGMIDLCLFDTDFVMELM